MKNMRSINPNAAGIDIGSRSHYVAVPGGEVQEFSSFTSSLKEMVKWLKKNNVDTVALESTGVYWIPTFELLDSEGFDVQLVDARQAKNMPGRKSDVLDCQWIQELHSFGLLTSAFRPSDEICCLRSLVRQKATLIKQSATETLHMQKSLEQMNLKLTKVIRYITGVTGMKIIRAIIDGERCPAKLASLRHQYCKRDESEIALALEGNYREEHLFTLKQSLDHYDFLQEKILECDSMIKSKLVELTNVTEKVVEKKRGRKKLSKKLDPKSFLTAMAGVDLTRVEGISDSIALTIISELGTDLSQFSTEKHFASWLGLCPGCKKSGGKNLSGRSRNVANRVSQALRMAANALYRSQSSLGFYFRRMRNRKGAPKAITAAAHKIAKIVYNMIKYKREYEDPGIEQYQEKIKKQKLKTLQKYACELGVSINIDNFQRVAA